MSETPYRRGGSHESDGVGAEKKEVSGREGHDEFMSHIIDWQPCCADCGNRFSLGAGETGDFTRSLH